MTHLSAFITSFQNVTTFVEGACGLAATIRPRAPAVYDITLAIANVKADWVTSSAANKKAFINSVIEDLAAYLVLETRFITILEDITSTNVASVPVHIAPPAAQRAIVAAKLGAKPVMSAAALSGEAVSFFWFPRLSP